MKPPHAHGYFWLLAVSATFGLVFFASGGFPVQSVRWNSPGWYVMLPPSEGGNYTSELAHALSAKPAFVVMDDFEYGGPQAFTVYSALLSAHLNVCLVLYPFLSQPSATIGASCVILPIRPGEQVGSLGIQAEGPTVNSTATWVTIMKADMGRIHAANIHLLVYEAHTSFWDMPVPYGYVQAAQKISQSDGEFMVTWP
jgi:hypothetical protein